MWSGQPPEGEQNRHSQNPYQQNPRPHPHPRNPYQEPGPPQQPGGGGGGRRAKAAAVVAATTVVAAVIAAGVLFLGGDEDDTADAGGGDAKASASGSRSASASVPASGEPSVGTTERPTVPGWKVVVNPKRGTAFDVPPEWDVRPPGLLTGFEDVEVDYSNPDNWGKTVIVMGAPAILEDDWCVSDDDADGRMDTTALAAVGTKGARGAESAGDAALSQVDRWVYGGYTQPDTKSITRDAKATPYTTKSGVEGSFAWARSSNTPREGKCASDGKAIMFGFKNSAGDFVAWCLYGATGVKDELADSTIMKILSTVRLHGDPTDS
ncbi:hypothetical protein ACFUIW_29325 [Streptomyces sp. NPDC057245]|uniref:hypothetical protein n=1 Tax=Streptomyces sp. NPDC057245 TaxID=3346065 RepID=UPI00363D6C1A